MPMSREINLHLYYLKTVEEQKRMLEGIMVAEIIIITSMLYRQEIKVQVQYILISYSYFVITVPCLMLGKRVHMNWKTSRQIYNRDN